MLSDRRQKADAKDAKMSRQPSKTKQGGNTKNSRREATVYDAVAGMSVTMLHDTKLTSCRPRRIKRVLTESTEAV